MADLTAKKRKSLKPSQHALPHKAKTAEKRAEGGAYPIHDEKHARNALARVSQHGTPEEKKQVRAKVAKKYPGIEVEKKGKK